MNNNEYENDLRELLRTDERVVNKYNIGMYRPDLAYEVEVCVEGEIIMEHFDVFHSDNNLMFSYSDLDNYRLSTEKTIKKYIA